MILVSRFCDPASVLAQLINKLGKCMLFESYNALQYKLFLKFNVLFNFVYYFMRETRALGINCQLIILKIIELKSKK